MIRFRFFSTSILAGKELNSAVIRSKMDSVISELKVDFSKYVIGRVNPSLIENLILPKSNKPLSSVAKIFVKDNQSLQIKLSNGTELSDVENAVNSLKLGIAPVKEGLSTLILTFPKPTAEVRTQLVKIIKESAESYRNKIRTVRRDVLKQLKQNESSLSKDFYRKFQDDIQKIHDEFIGMISKQISAKVNEIMK